jgi:hypothetical protein
MMATLSDIAQIILLIQAAFPNYHPEKATPDALYQFLQDLPSDTLKVAVLATCAEAGRAFAPSVGEIREVAQKISARVLGIPNEFEAWAEVCGMPKKMIHSQIEFDGEGQMVTNENGAVIIRAEKLNWSNELVGQTAVLMGWPEFPGEDESLPAPVPQVQVDRAHFFQAYRAEVNRMMEREGELPAVRDYVLERRKNAALPVGQVLKKLAERMEK